jgi:hypothetical protein
MPSAARNSSVEKVGVCAWAGGVTAKRALGAHFG